MGIEERCGRGVAYEGEVGGAVQMFLRRCVYRVQKRVDFFFLGILCICGVGTAGCPGTPSLFVSDKITQVLSSSI